MNIFKNKRIPSFFLTFLILLLIYWIFIALKLKTGHPFFTQNSVWPDLQTFMPESLQVSMYSLHYVKITSTILNSFVDIFCLTLNIIPLFQDKDLMQLQIS